jgi:hypothetical protein
MAGPFSDVVAALINLQLRIWELLMGNVSIVKVLTHLRLLFGFERKSVVLDVIEHSPKLAELDLTIAVLVECIQCGLNLSSTNI